MYLSPPTYLHTHFLTYKPAYLPIQFLPIYAFANPSFFVYLPVCLSVQSSAWLSLYLLASILSTFISCPLFPFSICSKPQATLPRTSTTAPHLLRHPPPIILPLQHSSTLYSHLPNKQTTLSEKLSLPSASSFFAIPTHPNPRFLFQQRTLMNAPAIHFLT